jgi:hypothetical protein
VRVGYRSHDGRRAKEINDGCLEETFSSAARTGEAFGAGKSRGDLSGPEHASCLR